MTAMSTRSSIHLSPASPRRWLARSFAAVACMLSLVASAGERSTASGEPAWIVPGGDARRGTTLIAQFGCGGCHRIPGVHDANGNVGPPLDRIGERIYIAGMLRNTPTALVHWIRAPQSVVPGNAMPDMGISEAQARDIAAYLYTLR
jgi:cytochrome c2